VAGGAVVGPGGINIAVARVLEANRHDEAGDKRGPLRDVPMFSTAVSCQCPVWQK
jgi:hypothetical protein